MCIYIYIRSCFSFFFLWGGGDTISKNSGPDIMWVYAWDHRQVKLC